MTTHGVTFDQDAVPDDERAGRGDGTTGEKGGMLKFALLLDADVELVVLRVCRVRVTGEQNVNFHGG